MNNKYAKYINLFFIFLLLSGLTLSIHNTYVSAQEDDLEHKLFKRIETEAGINNLEKVKDDIKRVLKLNPKHTGAIFYAGKYCFQQGNFEKAEKFLSRIVYDPKYGSKANSLIADMKIKRYNSRFIETLKVYVNGESFDQALKLCEDALADMPTNKELLFSAAYSACMLNKKEKAETYSELYAVQTNNSPLSAELKTLVDAWFTDSFDNQLAIEKFLSLKSKNILTQPVKKKIKNLLISSNSINRYEEFIKKELSQSGADKDALERELITFFIDQHQYDKALDLINRRPVDSIDDNLLYVHVLCKMKKELQAMNIAKSLMKAAPRDLRVYKAWVESWLAYTDRLKKIPEPDVLDSSGEKYKDTIENIFELLRPDKLVKQEPELLIDLLRMASFCGKNDVTYKIHLEVAKIAFSNDYEKILLKMTDELVAFEKRAMAITILESAVNQLPNNYNLELKLAQLYMTTNPKAGIRICEEVMEQNPDLIRAFTMWCDAISLDGRVEEAISKLENKLEDSSLNDIVRRQLNSKLELLRMKASVEEPYKGTLKQNEENGNKDSMDKSSDEILSSNSNNMENSTNIAEEDNDFYDEESNNSTSNDTDMQSDLDDNYIEE